MRGVVTAFDQAVGLGVVTADDGRQLGFHCVEITDGSRSIEVGRSVEFELLAKLGRYEAGAIRPMPLP
jgi:cold shock CspA family protein